MSVAQLLVVRIAKAVTAIVTVTLATASSAAALSNQCGTSDAAMVADAHLPKIESNAAEFTAPLQLVSEGETLLMTAENAGGWDVEDQGAGL